MMLVSIMITSRNRCEDLRRTLLRLRALRPAAAEIVVTADGCTDGTVAMMQTDFKECRLIVNQECLGSIHSRDKMLRTALGDLVLSLDDDSYPQDDGFLAALPEVFARHPEAAVIAFAELRDDGSFVPEVKSPQSAGHYVSAYANGAAAMNRQDYLRTGGFPGFFFHAYEEPDYALQIYNLGKAVWFEPSMIIRHHYSPANRNELRTHHFNARNELWSVWMRCPWMWLVCVSTFRLLRQFCHACSEGFTWMAQEPRWWRAALRGLDDCMNSRQAVPWRIYLTWMKLARRPLFERAELERAFGWNKGSQ